jgi:hypothetical protein
MKMNAGVCTVDLWSLGVLSRATVKYTRLYKCVMRRANTTSVAQFVSNQSRSIDMKAVSVYSARSAIQAMIRMITASGQLFSQGMGSLSPVLYMTMATRKYSELIISRRDDHRSRMARLMKNMIPDFPRLHRRGSSSRQLV